MPGHDYLQPPWLKILTLATKVKTPFIRPLHNSGLTNKMEDHEPALALLLFFSKILEKSIPSVTAPIRKGSSTSGAILNFLNTNHDILHKGQSILGILTDLRKAFDLVNHEILLSKLKRYGIRGVTLQWCNSSSSKRNPTRICAGSLAILI